MKRLGILLPIAAVAALLALQAVAVAVHAAPSAAEVAVQLVDNAFEPKTITISAGDTIVWTNTGQRTHTVTASDGSWDSGRLAPGQTFSRQFDTAGTINYYCIPHGTADGQGMAATIMVQAAGAAPQPAMPMQATPEPAPAAEPYQAPAGQAPAAPAAGRTDSVSVGNQALAGDSVTVAMVLAAQDGWMVIHANTADNRPGPVLGHTEVKAGENMDVRVSLSPTPAEGDKLWAMLHVDAGQMGVYEFPGADAPVNQGGQVVMTQFTVQGGAAAPAQTPAAMPSALPRTGDGASPDAWVPVGLAALALLVAGALAIGLAVGREPR